MPVQWIVINRSCGRKRRNFIFANPELCGITAGQKVSVMLGTISPRSRVGRFCALCETSRYCAFVSTMTAVGVIDRLKRPIGNYSATFVESFQASAISSLNNSYDFMLNFHTHTHMKFIYYASRAYIDHYIVPSLSHQPP